MVWANLKWNAVWIYNFKRTLSIALITKSYHVRVNNHVLQLKGLWGTVWYNAMSYNFVAAG